MRLSLVTPSTVEPLSLPEAKEHLRVSWAKEDGLINRLIAGARQAFEQHTGRQLLTASWKGFLDRFPPGLEIDIAMPPLLIVSAVTYVDTSGVPQTWSAAEYDVEAFVGPNAQRGMITPKPDYQYPLTWRTRNAVTIEFDAGYGATAGTVPAEIKEALLGWISYHYLNREPVVTGTIATKLPDMGFEPWVDLGFE